MNGWRWSGRQWKIAANLELSSSRGSIRTRVFTLSTAGVGSELPSDRRKLLFHWQTTNGKGFKSDNEKPTFIRGFNFALHYAQVSDGFGLRTRKEQGKNKEIMRKKQ
jgi:hypothetical protein